MITLNFQKIFYFKNKKYKKQKIKLKKNFRYVGEWKNGFRHGYGVFFYSNGAKYEGIWDQNYKHGFGIFTFHDGSQYIGRFHNDRMMDYNAFGYLGADDKQLSSKDRNAITTAKLGKKKANPLPRKNSIAKFENENSFLASQKNKERENTGEKANKDKPEKDTTANANLNQNNFINTVNSLKPQNSLNNAKENLNKNNKEKSEKTEKAEKTENSNSKEEQNQTLFSSTSTAKLGFGKPKPDLKANLNAAGLEAISEQAELGNLSMMQNEKKEKETSNALSYNNVDSAQVLNSLNQSKQVISNRILKESEYNVFKTLIDLTDIIECEPEIEASLKEVENILLRNLSDMKIWYRFYTNKDKERDEAGTSVNASALHTQQDEKEKVTSKEGNEKKSSLALNYFGGAAASNININFALLNAPNNLECVYNNDLGFAMEMKDLWKFLRDSNIISSEFSLAQFNRLFYKGKKNYIEMFMCPDDIETKQIYDYIYAMIVKSKEEFYYKNRDKLLTNNLFNSINNNVIGGFNNNNNNTNSITNSTSGHIQGNANFRQISVNNSFSNEQGDDFSMQRKDSSNHQNNFNNKNNYSNSNSLNNNNNSNTNLLYKNLIESNMDIHNKKQIVLLRQFFEAIVRAAYLRFFHIGQSLGTKLTILIDTCIKNNSNFKKTAAGRKSNREQTDNSINSSVYLDKKNKGFDSNFEFFTYNFEKSLKAIFKKIYLKFSLSPRLDDITITYRCFYDNYISKSEIFKNIFSDKFKFVEIINIYHKDKINVLESAKYTKEIFNYVENLYDIEIIFFEFCEVVFFMSRKYFSKNGLIDTRENYAEIVKDLEETIANLDFAGQAKKSDKGNYTFPKLKNHLEYESLISNKLAKEEEERKKRKELKRIEYERKMMEFEDLNILQDENEEEPEIDDESLESY